MIGHGLIAFAQSEVDVGTIGVIQVAQPALAVCWSFLILGESIRVLQVPGMILVIVGLAMFTISQPAPRSAPSRYGGRHSKTGSSRDQRAERVAAAADPRT